jgi:hypothetical protein
VDTVPPNSASFNNREDTTFFPAKYSAAIGGASGGVAGISDPFVLTPFTLASGIEARLIEAEVALHSADPTWLTLLNQLRETAPIPGTDQPAPQQLPDLTDPGDSPNDSARVTLLFAERAAWLFVTGERQGDLRRLLRQNSWLHQQQVYPVGPYTLPNNTTIGGGHSFVRVSQVYGTNVNAPVSSTELQNPKFHGCLDRNP